MGATVTGAQVDTAVMANWLREPVMLRVGGKDGEPTMPTSLSHRCELHVCCGTCCLSWALPVAAWHSDG